MGCGTAFGYLDAAPWPLERFPGVEASVFSFPPIGGLDCWWLGGFPRVLGWLGG